jgi:hypothetical protein
MLLSNRRLWEVWNGLSCITETLNTEEIPEGARASACK